jgi:hypothetical protein
LVEIVDRLKPVLLGIQDIQERIWGRVEAAVETVPRGRDGETATASL